MPDLGRLISVFDETHRLIASPNNDFRYFYCVEAFTGSARWYLGAVTPEQSAVLTAEQTKEILDRLDWHHFGGSYYDGRTGRTSEEINLNS